MEGNTPTSDAILTQILAKLDALQISQQTLQAKVCSSHPIATMAIATMSIQH